MASIFDANISHSLYQYRRTGKWVPNPSYRVYMCCKYWYRNRLMAVRLYNIAKKSGRYTKVKIHKNCVYLTKPPISGFMINLHSGEHNA